MRRMPHPEPKRIRMSASRNVPVALLVLAGLGVACSDYPSLTDISPPDEVVVDSVAPTVSLTAPEGNLERSGELKATLTDDSWIEAALAVVTDSAGEVLWVSDTLSVEGEPDSIDVSFPLASASDVLPFGQDLQFTVWALDAAERERFAGTPDDDLLNIDEAEFESFVLAHSQTFSVGEDAQLGGLAVDDIEDRVFFTRQDGSVGDVGALDLRAMAFEDWSVRVGSRPDLIAYQRQAWGTSPTLAVFNSGGTDVSLVDVTRDGSDATERWRVPIPLMRVSVDGETQDLTPNAERILIHCQDTFCHDPVLYIGSLPSDGGSERPRVLHALPLTPFAPDPDSFAVFAPAYTSGVLTSDQETSVEAWVVDASDGSERRVFGPQVASKCGTLAFGGAAFTTSKRPGGALFVAEQGEASGACGSEDRAVRFDLDGDGRYRIDGPSVINLDFDLTLSGIEEIATNDDGSLLLLRSGNQVYVTDGSMRRAGTVEIEGAQAVAALDGQTSPPGQHSDARFAVAAGDEIIVYEGSSSNEVTRFSVSEAITSNLHFTRLRDDRIVLFGLPEDGGAIVVVETTAPEIGLP